jgi:hypothetical protein
MNLELIKIIDKLINERYPKNNHKKFYSNEYYLDNIFVMLNDVNKWKTLTKLKSYYPICINNKIAKSHYDTIRKKFIKWSKDGIFKKAFYECINLKTVNKNIELIIDSTFINNKYGIEDIGLNTDNKKKKASKLSLICDEDKFIYSVINIKINKLPNIKIDKRLKKNKNKKNKKSIGFVHDVKTIQSSLDCINSKYNFKNVTLLGDKGYIDTDGLYYINKKKVDLVTIKKKNQKIKNKNENEKKLKKRIYVENAIGKIKKNERIMTRKDHNIVSYMGFVFIGSLINNLKIMKNSNLNIIKNNNL